MTARTVRDNGDGTITTVDDGVERRSVTAPGGSAPDAVAVAPVEAADIVETDVMRRWRAHGHVEIEGVAGYDVYVGGDDETPGTLRIDANDPGNSAGLNSPDAGFRGYARARRAPSETRSAPRESSSQRASHTKPTEGEIRCDTPSICPVLTRRS